MDTIIRLIGIYIENGEKRIVFKNGGDKFAVAGAIASDMAWKSMDIGNVHAFLSGCVSANDSLPDWNSGAGQAALKGTEKAAVLLDVDKIKTDPVQMIQLVVEQSRQIT